MIEPIAQVLNVPFDHIYCNDILLSEQGVFQGFDENQHTSRQGGKCEVIQEIRKRYGFKTVVMIGDGATDLETSPHVELFIGFGGIKVRDKVQKEATAFIYD